MLPSAIQLWHQMNSPVARASKLCFTLLFSQ
jgi:hypothetical protein